MEVTVRKPTAKETEQAKSWPVWEKEPSSFEWFYDSKETCLILEGSAKVEYDGKTVEFKKGDYVVFPNGLKCRWTIKQKIKKHYNFG
ncbi:MAG: cupin domain-containing protein [Candidatus Woesearchaeota archaeon]